MPINSDEGIRDVLSSTKTIALVGASPNPERASHAVMHYMLDRGYRVIPVNPNEKEILGQKVVASLKDIQEPVDMVDVFRTSEAAGPLCDEVRIDRAGNVVERGLIGHLSPRNTRKTRKEEAANAGRRETRGCCENRGGVDERRSGRKTTPCFRSPALHLLRLVEGEGAPNTADSGS